MATTGNFNGSLMSLCIDVSGTMKKVAHATGTKLEFLKDQLETSSKSSGGWETSIDGLKRVSPIDVSGYFAFDAPSGEYSCIDIYDAWAAGTSLTAKIGTGVTGDVKWSFTARFEKISGDFPHNGTATFAGTLKVTGSVTKGTES
ncbi:MAG: hypothetical protein EKK63_15890 [Acinetobacter sp.]|uniref:phage tail tube protein n=1 Tax=Acinetobacter sp. TaxID=472 RepID=UPI000FBFEEEC|nr:phage tail tube protein [Acinetobacter sp.]RUP37050.1 MAG: hypothetical protein EKK63_15890 [Acinetobacter sp.]